MNCYCLNPSKKILPFVFVDSYNSIYAYGQSKLANILHSNELSTRLKAPVFSCVLLEMMMVDTLLMV
jgi:hypothetical protein